MNYNLNEIKNFIFKKNILFISGNINDIYFNDVGQPYDKILGYTINNLKNYYQDIEVIEVLENNNLYFSYFHSLLENKTKTFETIKNNTGKSCNVWINKYLKKEANFSLKPNTSFDNFFNVIKENKISKKVFIISPLNIIDFNNYINYIEDKFLSSIINTYGSDDINLIKLIKSITFIFVIPSVKTITNKLNREGIELINFNIPNINLKIKEKTLINHYNNLNLNLNNYLQNEKSEKLFDFIFNIQNELFKNPYDKFFEVQKLHNHNFSSQLTKEKINKFSNLTNMLNKKIKGQENAINKINSIMRMVFLDLNYILSTSNSKKPKGVMFFTGPTGVGKTEIALELSKLLSDDENNFKRFDMSEYKHKESDQRLVGPPPGYSGYDLQKGLLTEHVKKYPNSLLLFDEIDKADNSVLDIFLQILDYGVLTDPKGEHIDFQNTFIIFTSNVGTDDITFSSSEDRLRHDILESTKKYFIKTLNRPELLNRISVDNIIIFDHLKDKNIIGNIIKSKLDNFRLNLDKEHNIELKIEPSVLNKIIDYVYNKESIIEFGARAIILELDELILKPFSEILFNNNEFIKDTYFKKSLSLRWLDDINSIGISE
ncbi:AAA family ATPase [Spiroplasma turonicum]|uniref:ATP-dependent Clp protease regulatory subunit n=1 Tax=Spiroplasma turonicum TaxID=216946 RepID=A0A0K1P803_9MOLU|nr:AAA family ATPase [Spiroplasma turonicum]AKU80002.1 ATP-dependent Clp protease regulatory subunit [Spiroplasma turonicum]ALX71004.1 hypothetical protein STURO_v1c07530 [Spiroplasma turonicum]